MKAIMMSRKSRRFTPEELKGSTPLPVFVVKSMPRRKYFELMAEAEIKVPKAAVKTASEGGKVDSAELADEMVGADIWNAVLGNYDFKMKVLEWGLSDWEGMFDDEGMVVAFSKEDFELLDDDLVDAIVNQIIGEVTEKDEKNSSAESQLENGSAKTKSHQNGSADTVKIKS